MAISKKRAPKLPSKDTQLNRVVQQIYDDINEIVNAVNQEVGDSRNVAKGTKGDLRVVLQPNGNYRIEAYTRDGWAETKNELVIVDKNF